MTTLRQEIQRLKRPVLPIRTEEEIKALVEALMQKMTLAEKIGQLYETSHYSGVVTGPEYHDQDIVKDVRSGRIGSLQGLMNNEVIYQLQRTAVKESRLGIPLFFALDIIHGCRTVFPTNLAMSCSFDPDLIEKAMKIVAFESSHSGVNLTFSPMLDLVRDPRWGRVMESNGEDPYLSQQIAKAYIRGYQQHHLTGYNSIGACAKHYVGYGAGIAGREYNTVDMSERVLFNYYLPPFQSAIKEGVAMVMTSFNTLFDVPVTANKYLLRDVLRDKLGFQGVTVSDYSSCDEIINHKIALDDREVAKKCLMAGLDIEMMSKTYRNHLLNLVKKQEINPLLIDEAVARILTLKYKLGLFDNPYKNIYADPELHYMHSRARKQALDMAKNSAVLLKNEQVLPLKSSDKLALIGPFIQSKDVAGAWGGKGNWHDNVTLYEAFKEHREFAYAEGTLVFEKTNLLEAVNVASSAEKVILALGEPYFYSGEASSRANPVLPEVQMELYREVRKVAKQLIVVIFAGRPLLIDEIATTADAILYAWQLGTESGHAIEQILSGTHNPSAKLTMTFPKVLGQVPLYYNYLLTGRPYNPLNPTDTFKTHYLDVRNEPLYPFGHGLSYASFRYSSLRANKRRITKDGSITFSIDITNDSAIAGTEIVQLYIEALHFSVSRPIHELRGFQKIHLAAQETKTVRFHLKKEDFAYYNIDMNYLAEPGPYVVKVGPDSAHLSSISCQIVD